MRNRSVAILSALFLLGACSKDIGGGSNGGGANPSAGGGGGASPPTSAGGADPSAGGGGEVSSGRLTGVNWFGFETGNLVPHGLWTRDYRSMLKQIKDLGFNAVRLPWCNDMLTGVPSGVQINASGVDAYTGQEGLNVDLQGLTSIEVMDKILDECRRLGLKVILDNHSRAHDGYMSETLWYTSAYPEADWISDWTFLVGRYKDNPAVVAADLKNEPHGNTGSGMKPPATWGHDAPGYGTTDWRRAAIAAGQAILAVNPRLVIVVEGTEQYGDDHYWWGGNLAGVADFPITDSEIPARNLWYSAHEYGPEVYDQPWFSAPDFPDNMPAIWSRHFWFIHEQGIAPLFFGEFGIKEEGAADPSSRSYRWFTKFMEQVGRSSSWTFWCMNPNSGDTGGILKDDWVSVNTAKYELIRPYLAEASDSTGDSSGLPATCPGSCNSATPVYPTLTGDGGLGNVTMYTTAASAGGACNYGSTEVMYFAAMSVNVEPGDGEGQWRGGRVCGQCAEVTALTSQGPRTVVVRIMDKCPDAFCGIDLGGSAPGAIMLDGSGRYDGKWRFVSCAGHPEVSDGAPSLAVLQGSNAWWSRVQVRNGPTAVDSIEWQDAADAVTHGTFPYAADPENSFEVPVSSVLQSSIASFLITVRYVDGTAATAQVSREQLGTQGGAFPLGS